MQETKCINWDKDKNICVETKENDCAFCFMYEENQNANYGGIK